MALHCAVSVQMTTPAFTQDRLAAELAGVLRHLALRVEAGETAGGLHDGTGAVCGGFVVTDRP